MLEPVVDDCCVFPNRGFDCAVEAAVLPPKRLEVPVVPVAAVDVF
jgi:hypothetical protein